MKPAIKQAIRRNSARYLLDRQNELILEIDRYLENHGDLSLFSRNGLHHLESILHQRIEEFEPVKKV